MPSSLNADAGSSDQRKIPEQGIDEAVSDSVNQLDLTAPLKGKADKQTVNLRKSDFKDTTGVPVISEGVRSDVKTSMDAAMTNPEIERYAKMTRAENAELSVLKREFSELSERLETLQFKFKNNQELKLTIEQYQVKLDLEDLEPIEAKETKVELDTSLDEDLGRAKKSGDQILVRIILELIEIRTMKAYLKDKIANEREAVNELQKILAEQEAVRGEGIKLLGPLFERAKERMIDKAVKMVNSYLKEGVGEFTPEGLEDQIRKMLSVLSKIREGEAIDKNSIETWTEAKRYLVKENAKLFEDEDLNNLDLIDAALERISAKESELEVLDRLCGIFATAYLKLDIEKFKL